MEADNLKSRKNDLVDFALQVCTWVQGHEADITGVKYIKFITHESFQFRNV